MPVAAKDIEAATPKEAAEKFHELWSREDVDILDWSKELIVILVHENGEREIINY